MFLARGATTAPGLAIQAMYRDHSPRGCSLNGDNLGRFNIIAVAPGLAAIRSPEGGNQSEDLPPCCVYAHRLVSDLMVLRIVPLLQWTRTHVFQSDESCEMKGTALSKLDAALGPRRGFLPEQLYDAQCVAADDPRLKP